MACRQTRRTFVKGALAAAGAGAAMSIEERTLQAGQGGSGGGKPGDRTVRPNSKCELPTGTLGTHKVSRVILGGNLIGGWAHARDLMYVSDLLKAYHTDEKVLDTLQLAEEHGINCINTHPNAGKLIQRYRKERGGKMVWMVQTFPDEHGDFGPCVRAAVDLGVDICQIQGGIADRYFREGKLELLEKGMRYAQAQGLPSGIGCHDLGVVKALEESDSATDFYVKTLHRHNYFSAAERDESGRVVGRKHDNCWCGDPKETIDTMAKIAKPWIAFKVMAAGAIHPKKAFAYSFHSGADFVFAGMFDFQIAEDASIARRSLEKIKRRARPWRA